MKKHLNASQISEWMAGERSPAAERHLRECAACRSQVENLQEALAGFRSSVRGWSAAQYAASRRAASGAERVSRQVHPRLYWAAMAAAVCALMAIFAFHADLPRHVQVNQAHSRAAADAALMRQVDTEVSQTVPDAMEPLMKLVAWDESPVAGDGSPNKPSMKEEE